MVRWNKENNTVRCKIYLYMEQWLHHVFTNDWNVQLYITLNVPLIWHESIELAVNQCVISICVYNS